MLLPSDTDSHTTLPETGITTTGRLNVLELMEKTNEQEPNFQVNQLNPKKTQPLSHTIHGAGPDRQEQGYLHYVHKKEEDW